MESSPQSRCGEIASDISIILVTVAQLIFFTCFHKYIAWYTSEADGSITRLALLTDDYFTWLPIPIIASIIVIVASAVMIIYDSYWFRQAAWIMFSIIGIVVVVSLLSIFPFDFSVIPNANASDVAPKVVTVFLIFMAVFYGTTALVMFVKLKSYAAKQQAR
jgi:hypothetical protein